MTGILFWNKKEKPLHDCMECSYFNSDFTGDKPCQNCHQDRNRPNFKGVEYE